MMRNGRVAVPMLMVLAACSNPGGPLLVDVTGDGFAVSDSGQDVAGAVDVPTADALAADVLEIGPEDGAGELIATEDLAPETVCLPDCDGRECGEDGCGGNCGTCPGVAPLCVDGLCQIECIPDCGDKECGDDGCGGDCGTCPGVAPLCVDGYCQIECVPDCVNKECGDDGCQGTCGSCDEGTFCENGLCTPVCVPDDDCTEVGLTQCTPDGLLQECVEAAPECVVWSEPEPCDDGTFCLEGECLEICVPACAVAQCGDDGCGGSCGFCGALEECANGQCQCLHQACAGSCCAQGETCFDGACCQSSCDGLACGPDNCGGSCGACGVFASCEDGQCWCDFVPCGDSCCAQDEVCLEGVCALPCQPDCADLECGADGCGGSCGSCAGNEQCSDEGLCQNLCQLACEGKACGLDGCGGTCGSCPAGQVCTDQGTCVAQCLPLCLGKECGTDGCGGSCGTCVAGESCQDGLCTDICQPDCFLKECGDDGCGGSCGTCQAGVLCTVSGGCGGECLACNGDPACSDIDFATGTLASWNMDAAVIVSAFGLTSAPTAGKMLKLTTGEGLTDTESEVHFQTCLEPGAYGVIVDWKFYSEEFKEWCGSNYQDSFHLWLETPEGNVEVADLTIKDLCEPSACATCGSHYVGLEPSDIALDQGGVFNTPWAVSTAGFALAGQGVVTLHAAFADAGDAVYDSVLLIDRIQFVPCEAYCQQLDCGGEPVCQCAACPAGVECFQGACCVPQCDGKNCGDDGCGGECGLCQGACLDGQCCTPDCAGVECGDDGCGGSCGACWGLEDTCLNGTCVCVPECTGKECGADGCGGLCGLCDDDLACSVDTCSGAGLCQFDLSDCCLLGADCDDQVDCTIDLCVGGTCSHEIDPDCCEPQIFAESFSGNGLPGWVLDPAVQGVGWTLWTQQGNGRLYYGNPVTHSFANGSANQGTATMPALELLGDAGYTLSFDVFMDVEAAATFDALEVLATVDGQEGLVLWSKESYDVMAQWQSVQIDLSGLAGHTVQLQFSFATGDSWGNDGLGVLIDDVELVSTCQALTCTSPAECQTDVPGAVSTCIDGLCDFGQISPCQSNSDCNDADSCTADTCSSQGYCTHLFQDGCCYADADCQDGDACTVDACEPPVWFGYAACANTATPGCCSSVEDCDDNNDCTVDSCPGIGEQCQHTIIAGCCLGASDCQDDDGCTLDGCVDHECSHINACCQTDQECDDGSPCTDDSCGNGHCQFVPNNGPGCCAAPLFRDDFSSGLGWTYDGDWERGEAQPSPPVANFNPDPAMDHSSSTDNFLAGYRIGANTDKTLHAAHYLTSPVVDISGAQTPVLTFWRFLNSDYPSYMTNSIEAFDGNGWVSLWTQSGTGFLTDDVWTLESYDVTLYKNANFQFRVGVAVGSAGVFTCPSWSVDDVQVHDAAVLEDRGLCCSQFSDCQGPVPTATACTTGICQ